MSGKGFLPLSFGHKPAFLEIPQTLHSKAPSKAAEFAPHAKLGLHFCISLSAN